MGTQTMSPVVAGGGSRSKALIALLVSAVIALIVGVYLALPVFTMGNDPTCGIEEHAHGDGCYATDRTLVCGLEESEAHAHADACKDAEGAIACGLAESPGHVHGDSCYLTESVLTCGLPEHRHADSCYEAAANGRSVESSSGAARTVAAQSLDAAPDYAFTADIPEDAGIPSDAQLVVREIEPGTDEFEAYASQAAEKLEDKGSLASQRFFDVSFLVDGEEVEPNSAVKIHASLGTENVPGDDLATSVVHFAEQGIEVIEPDRVDEVSADKTEVVYDQGSFSVVGFVQTNVNGFVDGKKYMLYADGHAIGIDASDTPSMGSDRFKVKVEDGRVIAANDAYAQQMTWVYRNGGLYNPARGLYLNFNLNRVYASSSPTTLKTRFVGNTVRLSTYSSEYDADDHSLYFGYDTSTYALKTGLKYASGSYFAVAEVGNYTPEASGDDLTVEDDIKANGVLKPQYNGYINPSAAIVWAWEKSSDGNSWSEVDRRVVSGDKCNVAEDGSWLNVAYDKGAEQYYRVRLASVNGVAYDNIVSPAYKVPYYNQLQNGSFEAPVIDPNTSGYNEDYQSLFPEETSGLVWKTTASDQLIEVASVKGSSFQQISEKWHNCPNAADGNQYAELNATEPGALYQDVLTTPGATMYWQASHRGRGESSGNPSQSIGVGKGRDTMYVVIMSTNLAERYDITTQARVQDVVDNPWKYPGAQVTTCTTDNSAWKKYSNTLTVPDDQYLTRFFFVAGPVSHPGTPAGSVGNHLDNVWFSEELPPPDAGKVNLEVKKTIAGLSYDEAAEALSKMRFPVDSTEVPGTSFSQLTPNGDGTFTATYVIRNLDLGSRTSRTFTVSENASSAEVEGYERATTVSIDNGNAAAGTSARITVQSGKTGTVEFTNSYEQLRGPVSFTKVDGAGSPLSRAKFALFADEGCTVPVLGGSGDPLVAISSDTGEVSFGLVSVGTYYLKEVVAPDGYKLDEAVYVVVVEKGQSKIYHRATGFRVTSIANESNGVSVRLWKLDDSGQDKYLEGARFELAKKNASGAYEKIAFNGQTYVEVDKNGMALGMLEAGEYRLTEILAPDGYYRITEPIYFTVADGQLSLAQADGKPWSLRELADRGSQNERQYSLLVSNHPGAELPVTGGKGVSPFVGGGVAMLGACLAACAVRALRRREEP